MGAADRGPKVVRAPQAAQRPPPSAALVLGTMAGALSALTFVPTAIPLIWQIIAAEEVSGVQHSTAAAYSIHTAVSTGSEPTSDWIDRFSVGAIAIAVDGAERRTFHLGREVPDEEILRLCDASPPSGLVSLSQRSMWAGACVEQEGVRVLVAEPLDPGAPARRVLAMVLLLAAFVGIVTALGVLRLLRPLSMVSRALDRVGAGERGVNVPQTGLSELDQLVNRLNAAARAVDDREDAILARIAVVQEMSRIVAHEVRNPLQSLELLTSLIASEEDPAERLQIAASIHAEIATLEQVVTRLLRESAAQGSLRLQITRQPLAPLVDQVLALRRPQANSQGVRLSIGAMSWSELEFDAALVKRSIENLVLNALQVVPRRSGEVSVQAVDEDDGLTILVDDNGPGVPTHLVDHIFEPNVTHGKKGGLGLGLVLVKGVIEAHNGYIRYESSPLGGARFRAWIPARQPRSEESRESAEV